MFKRTKKRCLILTAQELRLLRTCLIERRNELIDAGRLADPIDEMLVKLLG